MFRHVKLDIITFDRIHYCSHSSFFVPFYYVAVGFLDSVARSVTTLFRYEARSRLIHDASG